MPMYEYACRECGRTFEFLTREGLAPACPQCGGTQLEKALSTFAVNVASSTARGNGGPPAGCGGSCGQPGGPGSCPWAN